MSTVLALALLALLDTLLAGFRAAAGRDGRVAKAPYYRAALVRSAIAGLAVIAANAGLVAALVVTSADSAAAWGDIHRAGSHLVVVVGAFAMVTLAALAFWVVPHSELRLLPTLLVPGPLTLIRPIVIAGGLLSASIHVSRPHVWVAAVVACVSMLGFEHALGRTYARRWRRLL